MQQVPGRAAAAAGAAEARRAQLRAGLRGRRLRHRRQADTALPGHSLTHSLSYSYTCIHVAVENCIGDFHLVFLLHIDVIYFSVVIEINIKGDATGQVLFFF